MAVADEKFPKRKTSGHRCREKYGAVCAIEDRSGRRVLVLEPEHRLGYRGFGLGGG